MDATRVLVVANRTADSEELREHLVARHERSPIAVTLLAPAAWEVEDPRGGRVSALRRLRSAKARLAASGIDVTCVLGDPDPMTAFEQEWKRGNHHEVIVSTLGSRVSKWLGIDLPHRIERSIVGTPLTHIVATLPVVVESA
jgi:hypothetical protein